MSQRKTVTMFAETADLALVPVGIRSAHFAALVAADSVRAGKLAGVRPHVNRHGAAACWSISLSAELFELLEQRRGSVTRADYLLWLLRAGSGAVVEAAPADDAVRPGWTRVDGKLRCLNCDAVFVPAPKSMIEWKVGSAYELAGALRRLKRREPPLTPIHPMLVFTVPIVSELLANLEVGRRMLLLVGVDPAPAVAGPRRVGTVVAPESSGCRLIVPLSAYDVADARHQIGTLIRRADGVFACVTSACDGPEVEKWALATEVRFTAAIFPGTAVLMMLIERLS